MLIYLGVVLCLVHKVGDLLQSLLGGLDLGLGFAIVGVDAVGRREQFHVLLSLSQTLHGLFNVAPGLETLCLNAIG